MRRRAFIIFFSTVLSLYSVINFSIFISGWITFQSDSISRIVYLCAFLFFSLAYIAGRILERMAISPLSNFLVWIGSFWLAAMVYYLLMILLIDAVRLLHALVPFPIPIIDDAGSTETIRNIVIAIGVIVVFFGYLNARTPRIRKLDLSIRKKVQGGRSELNIVSASDIHLGTIVCKSRLEQIIEKINGLNPDIVLLPGDVVDEDLAPVIRQNLGETLRTIKSKFGVFAVTGNHEYIGGVEPAVRYLREHGITVLRDQVIKIDNCAYIVGREDISINRFAGKSRKNLEELVSGIDTSMPIILMDHQPFHLEEAEKNSVDLQLSGHTHHGQLWPFSFITNKMYEVSWGYKKKSDTHIYVSCGVGTWGPPVRTGNSPEIINIRLKWE